MPATLSTTEYPVQAMHRTHEELARSTQHLLANYHEYRHRECRNGTYRSFRYSRSQDKRAITLRAATEAQLPAHVLDRLRNCCSQAWLFHHPATATYCVSTYACKSRWCPICQQGVLRRHKAKALAKLPERYIDTKFITLTQPQNPDEELGVTIERIRRAFRKLRRSQLWRQNVTGGIYSLETKPSGTYDNTWHTHIHIIADADYMPQPELAAEWARCLNVDTAAVDIRRAEDADGAIRYLTKYITKPFAPEIYQQPHVLASAMRALGTNKHLFAAFGTWHGQAISETNEAQAQKPKLCLPSGWTLLPDVDTLIDLAAQRDATAAKHLCAAGYGALAGDELELPRNPRAERPASFTPTDLFTPCRSPP